MSRDENIRAIYKACVKLKTFEDTNWYPKIVRLCDVMAAIRATKNPRHFLVDQDGLFVRLDKENEWGWEHFGKGDTGTPPVWNIYKDNIEDQTDETIDWIARML